jgi:prepilin-type N-terminal cleavage/methylation domain-containing protein
MHMPPKNTIQLRHLSLGSDESGKPGFTLIELLVVIAIISLLSSAVLASLSGARESARITRTAEDLRQIRNGISLWMTSNGFSQYPDADNSEVCGGTGQGTHYGQNCPLPKMYGNPNSSFSESMSSAPTPSLSEVKKYYYSFEKYQSPDCDTNSTPHCGTSIALRVHSNHSDIADSLDDVIDDGDGKDSGRLQWWGGGSGATGISGPTIHYRLSDDHSY